MWPHRIKPYKTGRSAIESPARSELPAPTPSVVKNVLPNNGKNDATVLLNRSLTARIDPASFGYDIER